MTKLGRFDGERKSRQFTAAFKPSVFESLQKIAYMRQMYPNHLLGEIVEQYVIANAEMIAQYDKEHKE